jgi:predicted N-acetyltransferase YhbS
VDQHGWQGKTIGTNLIRRLCSSLPGNKVVLTVINHTDAHKLYERLGFYDLPPAGPQTRVVVMGASLPLPSSRELQAGSPARSC